MAKTVEDIYDSVKKLSKQYKSLDKPDFTRSGSVVMDAILGGGIPKGVFILWSAENGCGKSTGSLHISRTYCVQGKKVLYLDYEGGVNESQIDGIGLSSFLYDEKTNPDGTFFLFKAQTYKDAENILDAMMDKVDLVIIDSITAMLPEKIKEGSAEDITIGVDARIQSIFLKKYKAEAVRSGTSWIIINQMRTKIATGWGQVTHDDEAGGNALKYYCDIRLQMKKAYKGALEIKEKTSVGEQTVPYGYICELKAIKNRYERPMIPLNLAIIFGQGISNSYAYKDWLVNDGTVVQNGAWYTVKFGDFNEKFSGNMNLMNWIDCHKKEVREYMDSKGGYKLLLDKSPNTLINDENSELIDDVSLSDNVVMDDEAGSQPTKDNEE